MAQRPGRQNADRSTPATTSVTSPAVETGPDTPGTASRDDRIARRAYELYEQRGGEHGRAMDDWLQAEREFGQDDSE